MLERFRRRRRVEETHPEHSEAETRAHEPGAGSAAAAGGAVAGERAHHARARQRDRFGGFNLGAAFFGWLVAIGMAALLTALVSAAGAAIGLSEVTGTEAEESADTIGVVGAALLLAVLLLAYFAGGYVAGRMSRFDGGRQGFGVWIFGLVLTLLIAVLGYVAGSEYNVLADLDLPRVPVDEGSLATGGAIALALIFFGSLLAAILGGKAGQRYHTRVDRAGHVD